MRIKNGNVFSGDEFISTCGNDWCPLFRYRFGFCLPKTVWHADRCPSVYHYFFSTDGISYARTMITFLCSQICSSNFVLGADSFKSRSIWPFEETVEYGTSTIFKNLRKLRIRELSRKKCILPRNINLNSLKKISFFFVNSARSKTYIIQYY